MKKAKLPKKFKRAGAAYVGHAVVLMTCAGKEIIIVAPTEDEAVEAAAILGHSNIDRKMMHVVAISSYAAAAIGEGL